MNRAIFLAAVIGCTVTAAGGAVQQAEQTEVMRDSIVYLTTSIYPYSQVEPWRHEGMSESWACACAVGEYEVITTAEAVANSAFVRALRYGQSEFVTARPRVIDYRSNLCLLELDPNELRLPLESLQFSGEYAKGMEVGFYWLASDNNLFNGRGYLDRAQIERVKTSFGQRVRYVVGNASHEIGRGEVYCLGDKPIGIGSWADEGQAGVIPAETIRRFLQAVRSDDAYGGFGEIGFAAAELRDPTVRSFLKMPESLTGGVHIPNVYNLGTGHGALHKADVILEIDGYAIDSYGRYEDPAYGPLLFLHLITRKVAGESIAVTLWRDGRELEMSVPVESFKSDEMLVSYHEYDRQPEYLVVGGFVFQKLTREYLLAFGDNLAGEAPPHLYQYYRNLAFSPTTERRDIVMLSYVLPTPANVGYSGLGQVVVKTFNGMSIGSMADLLKAQTLNTDSAYHVVEFELENPLVVIGREQLGDIDKFVAQNYGIRQMANIVP